MPRSANIRLSVLALLAAANVLAVTYPPATNWSPYAPNALANADFQQMDAARGQPDRWYFFTNGADASWTTRDVEGVPALCLSHAGGDPAFFLYGGFNPAEMADLSETKRLVFTACASATTGGTASLFLTFRDGANNYLDLVETDFRAITGSGETLRLEAEVPANAAVGSFGLRIHSGEVCFVQPRLALLPEPADFTLTVNVDYADLCFYSPGLGYGDGFSEAAIGTMMANFAKAGVDRVHWRVSIFGLQTYYSEVAEVFPGSRYDPAVDPLPEERQRLADMLAQFDPLAVARRESRRQGIELYLWKDLYDEWGATGADRYASRFVLENPHYQTTTRDNSEVFKGVLSHNYAAVRAYRLAELEELLGYEPDGIYLSTRTHAFNLRVDAGDEFGFEQPVVDAFEARYGTDLRRNFLGWYPPFDREAWRALRSEGLSQLMQAIAERCQPQGVEVLLGVKNPGFELLGWPFGNAVLPWHNYLAEGWIGGVVSEQGLGYAAQVGHFAEDFATADASGAGDFHYWVQLYDYGAGIIVPLEYVREQLEAARTQPVGGLVLHQDVNLMGPRQEERLLPIARQVRNYLRPYPDAWWDWASGAFSAAALDDVLNWSPAMPAPGSGQPILHHYLYDLPTDRAFNFSPVTIGEGTEGGRELRLRGFDGAKGLVPELEVSGDLENWSTDTWSLSSGPDWVRRLSGPTEGRKFWRVVWRFGR